MEELALTYANLILDNRFRPRIDANSRRRAIYTQCDLAFVKKCVSVLKRKNKNDDYPSSFEFDIANFIEGCYYNF